MCSSQASGKKCLLNCKKRVKRVKGAGRRKRNTWDERLRDREGPFVYDERERASQSPALRMIS